MAGGFRKFLQGLAILGPELHAIIQQGEAVTQALEPAARASGHVAKTAAVATGGLAALGLGAFAGPVGVVAMAVLASAGVYKGLS